MALGTATYNLPHSSDRDKLRFYIRDTDLSSVVYKDEELDTILAEQSNLFQAAANALRYRMPEFIGKNVRISEDGGGNRLTIDRRSVIEGIESAIKMFESYAQSQAAEAFDRFDLNIDRYGRDLSNYQGVEPILNDDFLYDY